MYLTPESLINATPNEASKALKLYQANAESKVVKINNHSYVLVADLNKEQAVLILNELDWDLIIPTLLSLDKEKQSSFSNFLPPFDKEMLLLWLVLSKLDSWRFKIKCKL
jgi:hypothetical protein